MLTNLLLFSILIFQMMTSINISTIKDKVNLFEQKLKELYREEM